MSESGKEKECIISIRSNPSPTNNCANGSGINNLSSSSSVSNVNNNSTSSSIDECIDNNSVDHRDHKNEKLDRSSDNAGDVEESLGENLLENEPTTSKSQYLSPSSHLELFRKLEVLKEIKNKTMTLQRVKSKLVQEVDTIESESKCLENFKSELNLLVQEKMAHLEELRQIQNDISVMESTIKQSYEEKHRALESAMRLQNEYRPLKDQLNQLRESIGLEKTDENEDEDVIVSILSKLTTNSTDGAEKPERRSHSHHHHGQSSRNANSSTTSKNTAESSGLLSSSNSSGLHQTSNDFIQNNLNLLSNNLKNLSGSKSTSHQNMKTNANARSSVNSSFSNKFSSAGQPHHFNATELLMGQQSSNPLDLPVQLATAALMAHSLHTQSSAMNLHRQQTQPQHQVPPGFNPFLSALESQQQQQQAQQQQQQQQQQHQREPTPSSGLQSIPPPFRQQPPPMKSCLSCHQQIHRNAPICPLCKAKSRSRNPKKPKKKPTGPATVQPTATSSPASKSSSVSKPHRN